MAGLVWGAPLGQQVGTWEWEWQGCGRQCQQGRGCVLGKKKKNVKARDAGPEVGVRGKEKSQREVNSCVRAGIQG